MHCMLLGLLLLSFTRTNAYLQCLWAVFLRLSTECVPYMTCAGGGRGGGGAAAR